MLITNNRHDLLARKILHGARERAAATSGEKHPRSMVLRTARFVHLLKTAPHLIEFVADYANSAPGWPRFVPSFAGTRIELAEHVLG